MEEIKKKYFLIKTRNAEYGHYLHNMKSLFVYAGGCCIWIAQHENADVLEKKALACARRWETELHFRLVVGNGVVVETGRIDTRNYIVKGA